jgi:hypothetical protein
MPTVLAYTETKVYNRFNGRNYFLLNWTHLHETDSSPDTVRIPSTVKMRMKVSGTFGGGTVKLQGSMDGTTWFDLKDTAGSAIGVQAAGDVAVQQDAVFIYLRPLVSAGTGVDVTVQVLAVP